MGRNPWTRRPEWFADSRREPRWVDVRTVLARIGGEEYLGMTGDVSVGGMRLALVGVYPQAGDRLLVEVAYEKELLEIRGRVTHAVSEPWGSVLGLQIDETPQGYLARRYFGAHEGSWHEAHNRTGEDA